MWVDTLAFEANLENETITADNFNYIPITALGIQIKKKSTVVFRLLAITQGPSTSLCNVLLSDYRNDSQGKKEC